MQRIKRQFLPAPLHFSSYTPHFCKFRNWPSPVIWIRDLGVYYGFINLEVNHVAFRKRGCSGSKICINCWFSDYWIQKLNFYYGLVDPEWFFSIMNFWIQNAYFWITNWWIWNDFFNYRCFIFFYFGLTLSFMYYRKHQSEKLPDAPIRNFTGSTNPKIYRIS